MVAAAFGGAVVDVEELGLGVEDEAAFLAGLAHGGLAAGLAGVDAAAGEVEAGEVGMPHQEDPAGLVERHQPHPEAEPRPEGVGEADREVARPPVQRGEGHEAGCATAAAGAASMRPRASENHFIIAGIRTI